MSGKIIVANHVSSLFPAAQATSIAIRTSRRNLPLPPEPRDTDPPSEHASYSTVFHSPTTGTLVLRVIHSGLVLELISLVADAPPLRFVFPAPILPAPGIFLWDQHEVHIIAATTPGSLYRLVIPIVHGNQLGLDQFAKNWCREYHVRYASTAGSLDGIVQVQGPHCIAVGLQNGALLRLETDVLGDEINTGKWLRFACSPL
jgi:nuclear pore complex protein Nup160